jgi:hypothetical protein
MAHSAPVPAQLSRRDLLRISTVGASALGVHLFVPGLSPAIAEPPGGQLPADLYTTTLHSWCDGLMSHQLTAMKDPAFHGALLCPACVLIHGRCADAIYPLMRVAHSTGDSKYLRAAIILHDWSELQVSRADGSWINDVTLSPWQGITVFQTIALAESLHHHGSLLDAAIRGRWTDRLARAATFLDGFITIETGNINYPISASLAFALCGQVLGEHRYLDRARALAHKSLDYFTSNGLLVGEGHPLREVTPKGCHPVDLGYNVEESLPALAQYSLLTNDQQVLEQTVKSLRAHMEFMLPNGAWDNSWGTRNYKWSWWGSRTSDGCHPAYVLLSDHDPRFREVALRNLEMMSACTQDGLLYGGPDYFHHGDRPCIHHTFTHAKALATVLDRGGANIQAKERPSIPRDESVGLRYYPEVGTYLASKGPWRVTVTENDWEYVEHVQAGGGGESGGGHASGGALSLLFHQSLGPILVASMTDYQLIEISNQQAFLDAPHMTLTPRIELKADRTYTSLTDLKATLNASMSAEEIHFTATGQLLTVGHHPVSSGGISYRFEYFIAEDTISIVASATGKLPPSTSLQFIMPVVSRSTEAITQSSFNSIRITKPKGILTVHTDAPQGFESIPKERTFNLVPGLEAIPLILALTPGIAATIQIKAAPANI